MARYFRVSKRLVYSYNIALGDRATIHEAEELAAELGDESVEVIEGHYKAKRLKTRPDYVAHDFSQLAQCPGPAQCTGRPS